MTPQPVIELTWVQVALTLVLIAVVVVVGAALRLRLARSICVATLRAIVQLFAVGLVIGWVFGRDTWGWVLLLLAAMTVVAGITAARRTSVNVRWLSSIFTAVLGAATGATLLYTTVVILRVDGWDPRYLIPLGGMMLGNAMTAAALAVERLVNDLKHGARDVEALLAMGAEPARTVRPMLRAAVRAALTPTINTMMVVGIVQLPGMMTGQILGGTDPLQAAMYQFLILAAIACCATLAAAVTSELLYRRFFNAAWQLDTAALEALQLD